jgi:putative copper resistance protein D
MLMPEYKLGLYEAEAVQVSPNSYQGEVTFAMPGNWRFEVTIVNTDGTRTNGVHDFVLPEQPLKDDLKTYLSFRKVTYTFSSTITLIVGLSLVAVYAWLVWQSRQGRIPDWATLAGLAGVVLGLYLLSSVMLVKTYPSTYWRNPQPYTAAIIKAGEQGFRTSCAECHGDTGGGDGRWAMENRGAIPNLASAHMDIHTDGEIYWWVTHGIPSLDMPALADELPEERRWQIINYVRSLRHGVPGR